MSPLQVQDDWNTFVDRAVDELLADLAEQPVGRWGEEVAGRSTTDEGIRARLVTYSTYLLAAASTGVGHLQCDDGSSAVDCDFILRPNDTPYYRCTGHVPSHCYDPQFNTIHCP